MSEELKYEASNIHYETREEVYRAGYEQAARDIFDMLEIIHNSYKDNHAEKAWGIDIAMSNAREALQFDPFGDEGYLKNE